MNIKSNRCVYLFFKYFNVCSLTEYGKPYSSLYFNLIFFRSLVANLRPRLVRCGGILALFGEALTSRFFLDTLCKYSCGSHRNSKGLEIIVFSLLSML